jgi:hypothetical protein
MGMIKYRKTNHPKWKWELKEDYTFIHEEYIKPVSTDYIIVNIYAGGKLSIHILHSKKTTQ